MTNPTINNLASQIQDLCSRHEAALERAHEAREDRNRTAGLRVLNEADEEELAAAHIALEAAERDAASLASALALVEARHEGAVEAARAKAEAALRRRGAKATAARDAALLDMRESLAATVAAIVRFDDANAQAGELRAEATAAFDPSARIAEHNAAIMKMVDDAHERGKMLTPRFLDSQQNAGRAAIDEGAAAAADSVATVLDDGALGQIAGAVGLPIERLTPPPTEPAAPVQPALSPARAAPTRDIVTKLETTWNTPA